MPAAIAKHRKIHTRQLGRNVSATGFLVARDMAMLAALPENQMKRHTRQPGRNICTKPEGHRVEIPPATTLLAAVSTKPES